jgi:hypothetical protein
MHINIEIITAIISAIITYGISHIVKQRRAKQIQEVKEMMENMFIALCNANGIGDKFLNEYNKIKKHKNHIKKP